MEFSSNTIYDIYDNTNNCNASRNPKILNVFEEMLVDINKKFRSIVKEPFIR